MGMSRTRKGSKGMGYDFGADRAGGGYIESYGKHPKQLAHRRERRGGKGLTADCEYAWTKWGALMRKDGRDG